VIDRQVWEQNKNPNLDPLSPWAAKALNLAENKALFSDCAWPIRPLIERQHDGNLALFSYPRTGRFQPVSVAGFGGDEPYRPPSDSCDAPVGQRLSGAPAIS
jgi:hypothetical protein